MKKYTVKVTTEFAAAHSLRGYIGECARLHGHNWKVQAQVTTKKLNDIGLSVDFKNLKSALREVIDPYEHQNLNEIQPFDVINPTAENIAEYFFSKLKEIVSSNDHKLSSITIWETERSSITYSEDDD